jgi:hypothetical protein
MALTDFPSQEESGLDLGEFNPLNEERRPKGRGNMWDPLVMGGQRINCPALPEIHRPLAVQKKRSFLIFASKPRHRGASG